MDVLALLEELVGIDSVNASLGGPGERRMVERVAEELRGIGAKVSTPEAGDGLTNVIGVLGGRPDGPVLMLEAHLDTVPLPAAGLQMRRSEGRLYGRGSCDTKASAAAMLAAMARLAAGEDLPGTVIFAGVADEESVMRGSRALLEQVAHADAVVIGEPTSLRPARVHNGFSRIRVVAHGRAAHTSKAYLGVNAVSIAAQVVTALDTELLPRLAGRGDPLAGPALLTPAVIHGGTAPNIVPDRCEVVLDRRIAPGEDPAQALAEIDAVLDGLRAQGHEITREEPWVLLPGVATDAAHPVVTAAATACAEVLGAPVTAGGVPYSTDACQLSGVGGIASVVVGPGSIDQAHTDEEWVDLDEVERAVEIYERLCRAYLTKPEVQR